MIYNIRKILILVTILISGFSCDQKPADAPPEEGNKAITFKAHDEINKKFALSVDIVQIYSKEILDTINKMDSKMFQEKKRQLLLDHPDEFFVWEIDLINNQKPQCFAVPSEKDYWGIVIFLHFLENTENKLVFPPDKDHITLLISQGSFIIKNEAQTKVCHILNTEEANDEE
jgi:hypothetical protein